MAPCVGEVFRWGLLGVFVCLVFGGRKFWGAKIPEIQIFETVTNSYQRQLGYSVPQYLNGLFDLVDLECN